jgi:hypothetical protein
MSGWLFFRRRPEETFEHWRSPEQLRRSVQRERDLADRFQGGFSLLVFSPRREEASPQLFLELARILQTRLRRADEIGWLNDQRTRAAVVMHRTPARGAWKVADDLCAAFPDKADAPLCEVYTYPFVAPWTDLGDKDSRPSVSGQKYVAQGLDLLPAELFLHATSAPDPVGGICEKTSCV